jgi:hypothetical protein
LIECVSLYEHNILDKFLNGIQTHYSLSIQITLIHGLKTSLSYHCCGDKKIEKQFAIYLHSKNGIIQPDLKTPAL